MASPAPHLVLPGALTRRARSLALWLAMVLLVGAALGAAAGRAAPAPEQWQPTTGDLVRTVRTCPMQVSAPAQPVCWSMTEDTAAWMAQPAGSPYAWGQCTYYAGVMRPDIWNHRAPPSVDPLNDWDAWTWVEHAQVEGLAVDESPQPGDAMVYSRAAVGNSTGHVAIVDAVDGTDPRSGELELTISEMNVEGLDDAAQGQGDTSVLLVPSSQLVAGMIQFIHQSGTGYTAPAWSASYGGSQPPAQSTMNPSLSVAATADHLETVTRSPAPVQAVVTATATGATVKQFTVPANKSVGLQLPPGDYRICVSQAAVGPWAAATACSVGTWPGGSSATIHIGRAGLHGGRLRVPLTVAAPPAASAVIASASFAATARITITAVERSGSGRRVRRTIVYRANLTLHAGAQILRLNVPRHVRLLRGTRIDVQIQPGAGSHRGVVSPAHASLTLA